MWSNDRSMDLVMLTFFGARERTLREWKDIISKADSRFEVRCDIASDPPSDILDVVWTGEAKTESAPESFPSKLFKYLKYYW